MLKLEQGRWAAAKPQGSPTPWVPGYHDIAGQVDTLGREQQAERFTIGDNVAGFIGFVTGRWFTINMCVPETALSIIPNSVTLEAAAALTPVASQTAWHKRSMADERGARVLI
ncbi:hypothetical protein OK016_06070 [Vibrio chagasii]|nr:hypothetical protein [Vibrio chagasii]